MRRRNGSKRKRAKRFKNGVIPETYLIWRRKVLQRDHNTCQMPGCKCNANAKLNVHHIIRWQDSRSSRYDIDNGITLCRNAHKAITGKEQEFQDLLFTIVRYNKQPLTNTRRRT